MNVEKHSIQDEGEFIDIISQPTGRSYPHDQL